MKYKIGDLVASDDHTGVITGISIIKENGHEVNYYTFGQQYSNNKVHIKEDKIIGKVEVK